MSKALKIRNKKQLKEHLDRRFSMDRKERYKKELKEKGSEEGWVEKEKIENLKEKLKRIRKNLHLSEAKS